MDSYRSYWNSSLQSSTWMEGEDQDVYEVESRVPLPRPFPICSTLNEKNAVVVQTQISHVSHRTNGHLLKVISKISLPTPPYTLEHARMTQTELMRESFRHNEEMNELLQKQDELQERLTEEGRTREQLALELHRAEGLIDGYTGERVALEEQLRQKEELQLSLEQELQVTSSRLHELEQERLQMQEERELLSRQQDAMRESAGPRELRLVEAAMVAAPEADLLEEAEKLMKEKVEVQRQAEKENADLLKQVKLLEAELEEQVNRVIELEQAQKTESGDLQQQVQALEKQLDKNRRFLDEQAVDREHERDVFQQEIQKLEEQLKNPQKLQGSSEQRNKEVDQLTSQLKEKADWCSELLLSSEQLRRELGERDEEIDKLESRIRELEQALLASAESLEKVEQKKQHASITEARHSTLEAQLQTEREALERKEKEICNLEEQLEQFREELENKSEEVQQLQMQLEIQRKELSSQQQFLETRDQMLQEIDERDELIKDLETQIECLRGEQERLKRNKEEESEQLNAVIDKLQQELVNIEQKQASEEEELEAGPSREEYGEVKQRMDAATRELETLRSEHGKLLETYLRLKESAAALAESETLDGSEMEEALREKTAALVVMQVQVQALEQSAASRVEELGLRIQELEELLEEKDSEVRRCRLLVDQAQIRVSGLEENLREKVAAVLVSQATLEAFQEQQAMGSKPDLQAQGKATVEQHEFGDFGIPRMDFSAMGQMKPVQTRGRVVHLTQRLQELEAGLSGMQKDQELQKQLLSSSEEEVMEYERRLEVLMELLSQMKARRRRRSEEVSSEEQPFVSELLQELHEVKDEASSTKDQLDDHMETSTRLQDQLREKTATIERLQEQLQKASCGGSEETKVSELKQELMEAQSEAAATKEDLNSCRESLEKLQELLQEREMTIAHLKGELFQVKAEEDRAEVADLLQQLEDVRHSAASTKEEVNSYRKHNEKLQEELQVRERTISELKEELQEELQVRERTISELKEELQVSERTISELKEELQVSERTISELKEELQVSERPISELKEELQVSERTISELKEELKVREVSVSELKEELQEMRKDVDTTKEEVSSYRQNNQKLQEELQVRERTISELKEELQVRERTISELKEELQEVRAALMRTSESAPPSPSPSPSPQPVSSAPSSSSSSTQPKRKAAKQPVGKGGSAKEKPSLSRKNSSSASSSQASIRSHGSRANSSSEHQPVAVTDSFTQTEPLQMSDLSPHSEAAATKEIEDVIGEFQEKIVQMQELHAAEILDMESRHISESEILRRDTQALEDECKALKAVIDKLRSAEAPMSRQERPTSQFKDGYTSDSSSDYSQRTGYDLPSLQQEFRTTPEGARRETDDPLPDRIKTLLREVHQEGMQVLSLSELPLPEGEQQHQHQLNTQSWMKERDALVSTVESLRGLITQMQTHRDTQASLRPDWRSDLLDAVRQVFVMERSVLKSALYSQLDLLDTSDAIIHLNQLERRLAEQDAQHREAISSLKTAERSSLISEIHQLQGQLQQLHQGVQPGVSLSGECILKEQRDAGADGADGADGAGLLLLVEELKAELSQTKLELETTLKAQHKHLKELDTLRAEVSQKASQVDALSDELTEEKKKNRDLQWVMEKEKCKTGRTEDNKREELEDLQLTLEEQKLQVVRLTQAVEQEQQEKLGLHRRLQEVQVQLETERARVLEMSTALGRERQRRPGASSQEEAEETDGRRQEEEEEGGAGGLVERLQAELDHKHTQVVHLLGQVEAQKLEVVRKEEEVTLMGQKSRRDHEALMEAQVQLERLKVRTSEAEEQLEEETQRRRRLEEEKERLEERLSRIRDGTGGAQSQQDVWTGEPTDRTTDWVLQQETGAGPSGPGPSGPGPSQVDTSPPGGHGLHHGPWRTVDRVVGKLHLISSKIHNMAAKTTDVNSEDWSWVQSSVDDVINMLQQCPGLPSVPETSSLLPASSSSNTLTERLLRQNAELTGFVSRLTEEKNDLRNQTLRLEEELRRHRQVGGRTADGFIRKPPSHLDPAGLLLSQEREAWTREKLRLEKDLHVAQAQVARLRAEIRSDTLREVSGPEADNAALKRMYGKYLRSESFRKALIYQKKYLLLLLGGFQDCEEATLSLLSRMGGRPAVSSLDAFSQRRRGLTRFRSAVRVSIALSRMRFLVKRWHKATGLSSSSSFSLNKNGTGHTGEGRDTTTHLHPDRGGGGGAGGGGRGRSGRESPRSAVSSSQHRFHGEHPALTCSHLQNYDPDRALTDYISRLEALQRRLGSVTSGASSYAHLHFGLRR